MISKELILEAIELGVVILPFMRHKNYNEFGNFDESTKIGLGFICITVDTEASIKEGEFILFLETFESNIDLVAETPMEALSLYRRKYRQYLKHDTIKMGI